METNEAALRRAKAAMASHPPATVEGHAGANAHRGRATLGCSGRGGRASGGYGYGSHRRRGYDEHPSSAMGPSAKHTAGEARAAEPKKERALGRGEGLASGMAAFEILS